MDTVDSMHGSTEAHRKREIIHCHTSGLEKPNSHSFLEPARRWRPCKPYSPRQPQAGFRSEAPLLSHLCEHTHRCRGAVSVPRAASLYDGQVHRNMALPCSLNLLTTPSPTLLVLPPPPLPALENQLPKRLSSHSGHLYHPKHPHS